jgi:hypothetical protein
MNNNLTSIELKQRIERFETKRNGLGLNLKKI